MNLSNSKLIERIVLSVTAGTIFLVGTTFVFNNSKSSERIADSDNSQVNNVEDNSGIVSGRDTNGSIFKGDYHPVNIQHQINNPVTNIKKTTNNHKSETNYPNLRSNVNCNGQVKDGVCNVNGNVNFTSQH